MLRDYNHPPERQLAVRDKRRPAEFTDGTSQTIFYADPDESIGLAGPPTKSLKRSLARPAKPPLAPPVRSAAIHVRT